MIEWRKKNSSHTYALQENDEHFSDAKHSV